MYVTLLYIVPGRVFALLLTVTPERGRRPRVVSLWAAPLTALARYWVVFAGLLVSQGIVSLVPFSSSVTTRLPYLAEVMYKECNAMQWNGMQWNGMQWKCSAMEMQCNAMQWKCNAMQCNATQCDAMQ